MDHNDTGPALKKLHLFIGILDTHTAGRFLVSVPDYSEMQKLINYVNNFRTLPSKQEAYRKGSVPISPLDTCYPDPCKHHHSVQMCAQRQKPPPASAVPTAKVTRLLTTVWLNSLIQPHNKNSVTFVILAEDNEDTVLKFELPL